MRIAGLEFMIYEPSGFSASPFEVEAFRSDGRGALDVGAVANLCPRDSQNRKSELKRLTETRQASAKSLSFCILSLPKP